MVPTRDHKSIQEWAARVDAFPAQLRRMKFDGEPAVLTFTFGEQDQAQPDTYPISWDAFFPLFDLLQLSMSYR